uniref:Uncharacterized protein n=1 Tax=mine drainage metagenome TaxID=410659 RepID=E6PYW9_9ZZZZ
MSQWLSDSLFCYSVQAFSLAGFSRTIVYVKL